jgi:EAL domain-containing protein (putative c-di-GMP-specific phosphodiesterase class I)
MVTGLGRFAYEPLLNLGSGRPVGVEIRRVQARDQVGGPAGTTAWNARQLAEFDSGVAITSVLQGSEYDATVPLHVDVLADTVVAARARIARLRHFLRERDPGRAVPPILLEINPPAVAAAPPTALAEGTAELRAGGFGIGLDGIGAGFGLDLVPLLAPDLVKIEAGLVGRLPRDQRAATVVRAVLEVCTAAGVRAAAAGVRTVEELDAVREAGIGWAQGPLFGGPRRRPSTVGVLLPVELMNRVAPRQHGEPAATDHRPSPRDVMPVTDLAVAPVGLAEDVTAEAVRMALADHPQAGSVLLLDARGRPTGFLDRNRFMLAISGPFGRALYANRPARTLAEPPRTISADVDVRTALAYCLSGDRSRSYDDVVLLDTAGTCVGVVRVSDLLQEATGSTGSPAA